VVPAPSRGPGRDPFLEVTGQATQGDHGVYRGSPADDSRLLVPPARLWVIRVRGLKVNTQIRPEELRLEERRVVGVAYLGRFFTRRIVRPCLKKRHTNPWVCREATGEHRAGRSRANDDVVEVSHTCFLRLP